MVPARPAAAYARSFLPAAFVVGPEPVMIPFLERAIRIGIRRFVLFSASSLESGGPMMGMVHAWLQDHAPEWVVLRPTWFMQNFSEGQLRIPIRDEGAIHTATANGRIGFIDAENIAALAVEALSQPEFASAELILMGLVALSYDDVANTLSGVLKIPVAHHRLSEAQLAARHTAAGFKENNASEDTKTVAKASGAGSTEMFEQRWSGNCEWSVELLDWQDNIASNRSPCISDEFPIVEQLPDRSTQCTSQ